MTIDQIRYFLELSVTLNYSQAAEHLYVSQPSLSRQIQNLEDDIGIKLVNRNRQSVSLTPAGIAFKKEFSRILMEMDYALEKVQNAGKEKSGIRLVILQSLHKYEYISEVIETIHRRRPNIEISIRLNKVNEMLDNIKMQNVDLIITSEDMAEQFKEMKKYRLGEIKCVLVYPKSEFQEEFSRIEIFDDMKFITLDEMIAPGVGRKSLKWLAKQGVFPKKVIETGDLINTLLYSETGKRFSIMDEKIAESYRDQLGIIPIADAEMSSGVIAMWKKENEFEFEKMFMQKMHS